MSATKPKLSLEKVLHLLRKPDARLVRLHSNNGGAGFTSGRAAAASPMKSRNCCWGAMTYSPTATACFPATLRAGAWATGVTGPNVCEGGRVSDERPFDDLPRGHFGAHSGRSAVEVRTLFRARTRPLSRSTTSLMSRLTRSSRCRCTSSPRPTHAVSVGHGTVPVRTASPGYRALGLPAPRVGFVWIKQTIRVQRSGIYGHRHWHDHAKTPSTVCWAARQAASAPRTCIS